MFSIFANLCRSAGFLQKIADMCRLEKNDPHRISLKLPQPVKILQICMVFQDSVQRSLQNPADLHIFAMVENLGLKNFTHGARTLTIPGLFLLN